MVKPETNEAGLGGWIRAHLLGVVNLILLAITFSYNYGVMTSKLSTMESKVEVTQTAVTDIQLHGTAARPAYEARLVALEHKTDDLAVLKNIVQTQSDNIKNLTLVVQSDHDILIRLTLPK